jgi:hypothetical protein
MGDIYVRQSSFADGDTITSSLFNNEFDQLVLAFTASTGHTHDGTTGEGGPITIVGPTQDLTFTATSILPTTDDAITLGSSTKEFKDAYFDGTVNLDALVIGTSTSITSVDTDLSSVSASDDTLASAKAIKTYVDAQVTAQDLDFQADTGGALSIDLDSETLTIAGTTNEITTSGSGNTVTIGLPDSVTITSNLTVNGNTTLGNAATDTVTITADVASNVIPSADSTYTIGDTSNYWSHTYSDAVTTTGNVTIGGNLSVTGNATIAGNLTFGDAATDTVSFTADVDSHVLPKTDDTYDLGASGSEWRDIYIDGTAYVDAINYDGTAITATAAELNILDGVTATASEINVLDGITSTTAELNILDGVTATAAEINVLDGITSTVSELNILDGVTSTASELNLVDGSTAGTIVNSKAVIYGSAGEVNATKLQVGGTDITATPAEINLLDGATVTTAEINILDGVTATASEINVLDGITSTTAELNKVDGFTGDYQDLNYAKDLRATGVTSTEFDYLDGVTSNIQTQIDAAVASALAFSIALG